MCNGWGQRIKEARERLGMTQAVLARRLGVSRGAPSLWEIDRARPDLDRLRDLARVLEITMDQLVGVETVAGNGERGETAGGPSVPLLSPIEVALWGMGGPAGSTGGERTQVTGNPAYGKWVAMRVTGNAMAPAFPVGCVVVISREHTPTTGCPVVVDTGRGAPMLRYLIDEGVEPMLSPENPLFPVVPLGKARIVGRVIEIIVRSVLV